MSPFIPSGPPSSFSNPSVQTPTEKAQKSAQDFEAMFMDYMVTLMFPKTGLLGGNPSGTFGGGVGEEMLRPLWVEQVTKQMAQQGVGISSIVQETLLSLQESKK